MKSEWYSKLLTSLGTSLMLLSVIISPALAAPSNSVNTAERYSSSDLDVTQRTRHSLPAGAQAASVIYIAISAGGSHTCGLTSSGGVKCWGHNRWGQLGDGTTTDSNIPVDVSGLTSGVSAISAGGAHTCALTPSGVRCWGYNGYGELGNGTTNAGSNTPVDVVNLASGVSAISTGYYHTCALSSGGGLNCWGNNKHGQLGNGTTSNSNIPVAVSGVSSGASVISAEEEHTCALTTSGSAKCWGWNFYGQLGNGTNTDSNIPVGVSGLTSGVNAVSAGRYHTCALTTSDVKCWGPNWWGMLGNPTSWDSNIPVDVIGLTSGVSAISASENYTCVVTSGGSVKCWGWNGKGQLGDGTYTDRNTPVDVIGLTSGIIAISTGGAGGEDHACALTTSGGVKCWGYNLYGELGDGTNTNSNIPMDVVDSSSISGRVVDGSSNAIAGVSVSGGAGHTATTDSFGYYSLSGFAPGIYAITPSKTGYTFSPISRAIYLVSGNMTGVNFTGTLATYTISGRILDGSSNGVAGVSVSDGAGHIVSTDGSGDYTLNGLAAGTHTIVPLKAGYAFTPPSRTVTVPPTAAGQDFVETTNQCANTADSDGDGLLDGWEICGYDADGNGTIDVNLPALGANPLRKDIFVEADYMVQYGPCQSGTCVAHSHQPKDEAIALIVRAFADAPVSVAGGLPGIALHVEVSDAIPHQDTLQPANETWNWSGFNRIKNAYFDPRRARIYHYVVFAHDLGSSIYPRGTSGLAGVPGSDFVAALGQWADGVGTVNEQAGTFMHELGHNLGLLHGGNDDQNYEPNYLSIMNYSFQTDGLIFDRADGRFDYSRFGSIPSLDENHLDETVGLNGGSAIGRYGTRYYCWPFVTKELFSRRVERANDPIDWDCLLGAGSRDMKANINNGSLFSPDFTISTLTGFDDWAALVYDGGTIGPDRSRQALAPSAAQSTTSEELTFKVADQFYRLYAVILGGAGDIVASPGAVRANVITLTNTGALTATVTLSYTTGLGWFNMAAVPLAVTVAPSVSLSFPVTLTAPSNASNGVITDSVTISATVQESPRVSDSATLNAHLGPLAQYIAEPAWGTRPLTVTFTDVSVGNITTWLWDFGDGTTGTLPNASHAYTKSGVYTVKLTASGPDGTDSKTRQVIVSDPAPDKRLVMPLILRNAGR
jgi:alpha-tubulin suppressor-like RCC1 family protein